MRWPIARLIFARELMDQLRDRRTLFMTIFLPLLLYPVLGFLVIKFAMGFADRPSIVGVVRGPLKSNDFPERPDPAFARKLSPHFAWWTVTPASDWPQFAAAAAGFHAHAWVGAYPLLLQKNAPALLTWTNSGEVEPAAALVAFAKVQFKFLDENWKETLDLKEVDLVLEAPPDFFEQLDQAQSDGEPPLIAAHGRIDDETSKQAWRRVQAIFGLWKAELKRVRLARLGLPSQFDEPFQVEPPTLTRPQPGAGNPFVEMMVRVFPFMLVMWSLAGALYPAVDLCAGEKERGTMETLLISPAGREEIVVGKFLAIWVLSCGTAYLNLWSMAITTSAFVPRGPGMPGSVPIAAIFWCMVLLLPLSAFFSALCLSIGAYARSTKEGQYYLMPLFIMNMPLIFMTLAPGVELNATYSLIPVTGVALLMQKLMQAQTLAQVPWLYFLPVLLPMGLYSFLALRWAIDQFHREEVLFREAERLDLKLWFGRLLREKLPTPSTAQAFAAFGVIFGMRALWSQMGLSWSNLMANGIGWLTCVATPVLLMTVMLHTLPAQSLRLSLPRPRDLGLAAVLAVLLLPPLAGTVMALFTRFPHLSRLLQEGQPLVQELVAWKEGQGPVQGNLAWQILFFALVPAVCQEIAFRGYILSGLQNHYRPRTAVILSSFAFALFQLNVFQFLPAFFLGVVLGLLTLRSQSLFPALLFHFLHNSVLILGIATVNAFGPSLRREIVPWWPYLVAVSLATALAILWWLYRKPYVEMERMKASGAA